jgi:hypothetical protein
MTTGDYDALPGATPEEKMRSLGIVKGTSIDLRSLSSLSAQYGVATYLFFEPDLAENVPLEQVIHRYKDVPDDMRPYIHIEAFLRFIHENDPSFSAVMAKDPVMVRIVTISQIAAAPSVPPLVYITGLMPFLDEMHL